MLVSGGLLYAKSRVSSVFNTFRSVFCCVYNALCFTFALKQQALDLIDKENLTPRWGISYYAQ